MGFVGFDDTADPVLATSGAPGLRRRDAVGRSLHDSDGFADALPQPLDEEVSPQSAVVTRDRIYRRLLACADVAATLVALLVAVSALSDDRLKLSVAVVLPVVVVIGKALGLYDRDELLMRKSTLDEAPQLFLFAALDTLVLWLLEGAALTGHLAKGQVVLLWSVLFLATFLGRVMARRLACRIAVPERCLFIGDAATYARVEGKVNHGWGVELVGRMSLQRISRRGSRSHDTDQLRELIGWANVHRIILEAQILPPAEMLDLVRSAKSIGVRVSLLPQVFDVIGSSVVFDELAGMTVLGIRRFGLTRSSRMLKRALDLVGGGIGLLAAAPLLALFAVAIKLDSRGPVLFRQTRIGRDGRPFRICKFRTMVVDAEARKAELQQLNEAQGGMFKIAADPRITRIGRLLRKTSLDELPQLFNVIAGSMSLVGPRPLILDEDERIIGLDRHRLALTPGMTGPWQALGGSSVLPMSEMLKIDYLYIAGWSLWSDVKVMLRTVAFVLARRGV